MRNISIYGVISVLCLAIDVAALWLLVRLGMLPALASMVSYMLGLVVHYILSVRHVFIVTTTTKPLAQTSVLNHPAMKHHVKYFVGYFLTGLAGGFLTAAIISIGERLSVSLVFSKAVAIGVAFFVVYGLRKYAVFGHRN